MKKLLLIATGGTIACSAADDGLSPVFCADQLLSHLPDIHTLCQIDSCSLMAIDSTDMTPERMARIAETIFQNYQDYDGFIVTHGTDTLGYTSAALTYMLPNIGKPVVVTGSQLAIEARYTDAKVNISDAIRFALEGKPGIFVAFDGKIINGTRAKKIKTQSMDAFASVNFPLVAEIKLGRVIYNNVLALDGYAASLNSCSPAPFDLRNSFCDDVFLLKISPCIKADFLAPLKQNCRGVVIEGFGIGGIPGTLLSAIEDLIKAGIAVVIGTQCLEEGVDLDVYEVGQNLAQYDVIYAGDMTSEALVMKLMWALGNCDSLPAVKAFMETPVFGDRMN